MASQPLSGLPYLVAKPKRNRGRTLNVSCNLLILHSNSSKISRFVVTDEPKTGVNPIVQENHYFANDRTESGLHSSSLFVQVNIFTRENKNRYVFA